MSGPSVVLAFLDGVGIGPADAAVNPFLRARLPTLSGLLDGVPTLDRPRRNGARAAAFPLDATLGVEGTPQSGTGQATLLTGVNAAQRFGRHFGPWTPVALRPLVEERSILRRGLDAGITVAFADAYPKGWPNERRRLAAPPLAARAAGLLDRHEEHLARGEAVASEILNTGWRDGLGFEDLPVITAAGAGRVHRAPAAARGGRPHGDAGRGRPPEGGGGCHHTARGRARPAERARRGPAVRRVRATVPGGRSGLSLVRPRSGPAVRVRRAARAGVEVLPRMSAEGLMQTLGQRVPLAARCAPTA
ncbi:MAG: hypothetical protein EXR95_02285 [Gemmatimonadetes bacterium]|nr:hypothetical protein [Gemmatimonadota bacterium]